MIVVQLLLRLKAEGETIVMLTDPALIEQIYKSNTRVIYFVDDAFGTPTMNKSLVDTWNRLYDKLECLIEAKKCGLILTSRKQVHMQCAAYLHKCTMMFNKAIDISDNAERFSPEERTLIAAQYIMGVNNVRQKYSVHIPVTKYIPGFPLMCKIYSTNSDIRKMGSGFFENPIMFLKEQIEHLVWSDQSSYCGLVLITMFDGRLSMDLFDEFEELEREINTKFQAVIECCGLSAKHDKSKIKSSLHNMIGVFVEVLDDDFIFLHSAINDAVCFVFGKRQPKEILKVASAKFVEQRIRTKEALELTDKNDVIVLQKAKYLDLGKRWIRDMKEGNVSSVYDNPSFFDSYMNAVFIDTVHSLPKEDIWQLISTKDKTRKKTYIFLACKAGLESTVISFLNQLDEYPNCRERKIDSDILVEALLELMKDNFPQVVKSLISLGVINPNYEFPSKERRLVHAVASVGDSDVLGIILGLGASISIPDDSGALPIHYAVTHLSADCLDILLRYDADVNVSDSSGRLPIHYAARDGCYECIQRLIEHGSLFKIKDMNDKTSVHYAAMNKDVRILKALVQKGLNVDEPDLYQKTPLHYACQFLRLKNIKHLVEAGAMRDISDARGNLPIHLICDKNNHHIHRYFSYLSLKELLHKESVDAQNDDNKTILALACNWPHDRAHDIVGLLLQTGADPNIPDSNRTYPLHLACDQCSPRTIQLLLQHGASPTVVNSVGRNILHLAAAKLHLNCLEVMKDWNADVTQEDDDGKQPLHIASQYGNDICVRFLIERGANVSCQDRQGITPLHSACKWNKLSTVKLLLKHGADPSVKDNDGRLPKDMIPMLNLNSSSSSQIRKFVHFPHDLSEFV